MHIERTELRPNMILYVENPARPETGLRIVNILENGITVRRINAFYLNTPDVETWVMRWDQLENSHWQLLPIGFQMPLL